MEFSFYLVPGFETLRDHLAARFSRPRLAAWMAASGLAPWLIYTTATGEFRWLALLALSGIVTALCFWFVALRASPAADIGFLLLVLAIALSNIVPRLYPSPVPQHVEVLGHLMLIRTSVMSMLALRGIRGTGFGFLPTEREWVIGLRYFFFFLPVGIPLAVWLGMVRFNWEWVQLWKCLLVFAGMLWVVALSEEFFFRGLLQQWLTRWTGSPGAALLLASLVFGLCHLPFRMFPNWKLALLASIAGVFYGRAYQRAGGIRAPMVSHALVATAWRVLLAG